MDLLMAKEGDEVVVVTGMGVVLPCSNTVPQY